MNNDLISREALRESFKAWKNMDDYYHDTDCDDIPLSEAFDLIDNAPSVFDDKAYSDGYTQGTCDCEHAHERPQGEWMRKVDDAGFVSYICSECGAEIEVEDPKDDKFCFNCGAKMISEGKE